MVVEIVDKISVMSCGSVVQHGHANDRVYLMKVGNNADDTLPHELITIAEQNNYTKIFVKIPSRFERDFLNAGFIEEAIVPRFYNGTESGHFMAYYLSEERAKEENGMILDENLVISLSKATDKIAPLDDKFKVMLCMKESIEEQDHLHKEMAEIYKKVFPTYPFPIYDPAYLAKASAEDVVFFGVEHNEKLLALSSAEIDRESLNAEMTDFATLQEWRGKGLGAHLLLKMEHVMKSEGIKIVYTISRAVSIGINTVFARCGYSFGGRLKNNTHISGNIESMNVWYKSLG